MFMLIFTFVGFLWWIDLPTSPIRWWRNPFCRSCRKGSYELGPFGVRELGCIRFFIDHRCLGFLFICFEGGDRLRIWVGVFYSIILVIFPLVSVLLQRENFFYPRYFLVSIVFFLVLFSRTVAEQMAMRGVSKAVALVIVILTFFGNAMATVNLWKVGRGSYLEALNFICKADAGAEVTVGGDHDSRNLMLVNFYTPYAKNCRNMNYLRHDQWGKEVPHWLLVHSFRHPKLQPVSQLTFSSYVFAFQRNFESVELSGWNWAIYRLVGN